MHPNLFVSSKSQQFEPNHSAVSLLHIPLPKKKSNKLLHLKYSWLPVSRGGILASFSADWWIPSHRESPPACSTLKTRCYFTFPNFWMQRSHMFCMDSCRLLSLLDYGVQSNTPRQLGSVDKTNVYRDSGEARFPLNRAGRAEFFLTISEGPRNKGFPRPAHESDSTVECRPAIGSVLLWTLLHLTERFRPNKLVLKQNKLGEQKWKTTVFLLGQ